jgi:hypothetical protein
VLVNRPLNAMTGGRLVRLADPPRPGEPGSDEVLRAHVAALGKLETALARYAAGVEEPRVSEMLLNRWDEMAFPQAFQQALRFEVVPEAQRGLRALLDAAGGQPDARLIEQIQAYQAALNGLVEPLQARASRQDSRLAEQIRAAIQPALPPDLRNESLSRIALDFVASTPGVSTVLCGMRHPAYVEDATGLTRLSPIADVTVVASAIAAAIR